MARALDVPGLDCGESFAQAAARVVEVRANEVFAHAHDVLDVDAIEHLHDMRVATRRLRAAMEMFEPCFPRKRWRKALKRVKELADALGQRRDRDVAIDFLAGFAAQAPEPDRAALEDLIEELRDEQRQANDELAPFVAPQRLEKLQRRLHELVKAVEA